MLCSAWSGICAGMQATKNAHVAGLLLVKSEKIRRKMTQTILLNGVIFIGSILFYQFVIDPSISKIYAIFNTRADSQVHLYLYSVYVATWVFPMYILSFVLNTVWYQDIASETARLSFARPQNAQATTSPALTVRIADLIYKCIFNCVFILQGNLAYNFRLVGFPLYVCHLAFLFALSAFEYRLTPQGGWTSDRRLAFIQQRWPFFLGFGLIPASLASLCPRFVEAGVLALLLPLGIVAAVVAPPRESEIGALPIFAPSVFITAAMVRTLDLSFRSPSL